jgi:hypothetical protein
MKEILLILRGMRKRNTLNASYGELSLLMSLILNELAPEKVKEAERKLKDFDP